MPESAIVDQTNCPEALFDGGAGLSAGTGVAVAGRTGVAVTTTVSPLTVTVSPFSVTTTVSTTVSPFSVTITVWMTISGSTASPSLQATTAIAAIANISKVSLGHNFIYRINNFLLTVHVFINSV
jgi:hypothetical protein